MRWVFDDGFPLMDLKFIIRNNMIKIYGGRIAGNLFM